MITSLFPIPGSKRGKKYEFLKPSIGDPVICEPFMGGAARSLATGAIPVLGEINAAHRLIAFAPTSNQRKTAYIQAYNEARSYFLDGINLDDVLRLKGVLQSQKVLKSEIPDTANELTERWHKLKTDLFTRMSSGSVDQDYEVAGFYSFCQRSCFGNVMRLNPRGTHFNVSWHVEKLANAIDFQPEEWVSALNSQGWKPKMLPSWQDAIAAVKSPRKTYLLLDPPYWVDGEQHKCTPCYPGHRIGTKGEHDETFDLAVLPLIEGMRRGFPLIHLCNYHSDRLESEAVKIAFANGYSVSRHIMGECRALGNSNGRLEHGNRVDEREKPVEVIWEFKPAKQLSFSF